MRLALSSGRGGGSEKGRGGMGWADLTSLFQPKTSSGTFWSETPRRGSPASRPYSIFGEWNPCQDVPGPEGRTTPSETPQPPPTLSLPLGYLVMQPLTETSWAPSVSRSRRILPGPTGRSVWGGTCGPSQLKAASPPTAPSLGLRGWPGLPVASVVLECWAQGRGMA